MVLPLQDSPTAPAQGALSVECRADDLEVRKILERIHDPLTEQQVSRERQILADWGGGCHQRFGATETEHSELGKLLFIRGRKHDSTFVEELRWGRPQNLKSTSEVKYFPYWDGSQYKPKLEIFENCLNKVGKGEAVFIAHSNAILGQNLSNLSDTRLWTSGAKSWFKLAKAGLWVEGSAESLGFQYLAPLLKNPVLGLPQFNKWLVLTNEGSCSEWDREGFKTLATYSSKMWYEDKVKQKIAQAKEIFWSTGSQYEELSSWTVQDARHACGPGKTAKRLREMGINPFVFPSVEEWRKWLEIRKLD